MAAFKHSVRDEWLARHLGQNKQRTMAALTSLMTSFCAGEDSWLARCSTSDPSTSEVRDGNKKSRRNSNNKRRNKEDNTKSTVVNARFKSSRTSQRKPPSKGARDELSSLNKILDQVCQIHSTPGKPANHTTENVGSSSSPVSSTPYTRGRIHQAKTRMSLPCKTLGNKRSFHQKSK